MQPKMFIREAAQILGKDPSTIQKMLVSKKLRYDLQSNRGFFLHDTAKTLFNFKIEPKIFAVYIQKGGTGKTTITENLSYREMLYGFKVLAIDSDPQASLTRVKFKIKNQDSLPCLIDVLNGDVAIEDCIINLLPGLDFIPSKLANSRIDKHVEKDPFILKKILQPLKSRYDIINIDCGPRLGEEVAGIIMAADTMLCPMLPDSDSEDGLNEFRKQIDILKNVAGINLNYKIILNNINAGKILSNTILHTFMTDPEYFSLMMRAYIQTCQELQNCTKEGKTIFDNFAKLTAKEDFDRLIQELFGIGTNASI